MQKRIMITCFVLALGLGFLGSEDTHAQAVEVKVRNATDFQMQELYLFAGPDTARGENRLSGSTLFPGEEVSVSVSDGDRFVLAVDSEGDRYLIRDLDPSADRLVTISLDNLHFGEDIGATVAAGTVELEFVNATNYRFTSLWYRPNAEADWRGLDLRALEPGARATAQVPVSGDVETLDLRAQDEDGDYYEKSSVRVREEGSIRFSFDDLRW